MEIYLSRYQAGECEAVWRELQALGAAVREEPVYSYAVAVAQETMRRTRANIETLIPRLTALGYRFGRDVDSYGVPPITERVLHSYKGPALGTPLTDIQERIAIVEASRGVLPISLRAFYEIVGSVDLRGYFPIPEDQWDNLPLTPMVGESPYPGTLDPLQVFPFPVLVESAREPGKRGTLPITPDPVAKMDYSAVGWMEITMPCETMDASVWLDQPYEGEDDPDSDLFLFVGGLRRAFHYGGFNHFSEPVPLSDAEDTAIFLSLLRTPDGESYQDYLTRDLLPI